MDKNRCNPQYQEVEDDGKDILRGYQRIIDKLKNELVKYGTNYKINEKEYGLLYHFIHKSSFCNATIKSGDYLYRARIIDSDDFDNHIGRTDIFDGYSKEQCGAPPANLCVGQRVNSEYQRYLYCARNEYTALAEVRPFLKQKISIAKLRLSKHTNMPSVISLINLDYLTT